MSKDVNIILAVIAAISWVCAIIYFNRKDPIVKKTKDGESGYLEMIHCRIQTPQFHGSQDVFHLHRQEGYYDNINMKFYSSKKQAGDHDVQFHSQEDFLKALVEKINPKS
jgi:hypothetical protein